MLPPHWNWKQSTTYIPTSLHKPLCGADQEDVCQSPKSQLFCGEREPVGRRLEVHLLLHLSDVMKEGHWQCGIGISKMLLNSTRWRKYDPSVVWAKVKGKV